jgi:hypothetical protein
MVTKRFAQCPMKKMRCSVIALDGVAAFAVDNRVHRLTDFDVAFKNFETVTHNTRSAVQSFCDAGASSR